MTINYQNLNLINLTLKKYKFAKLLIVTKNQNIKDIIELLETGHRSFGENKVQEAGFKYTPDLRKKYADINLSLIGPLQSNKTKQALKLFDTIQSLDRKKIIDEIVKQQNLINTNELQTKNFYLQVNIGMEEQKFGFNPNEVSMIYKYSLEQNLNIIGLMCIPPNDEKPEFYFRKLKTLRDKINPKLFLSMGMSSDYTFALLNGSNLIRVGSMIFK